VRRTRREIATTHSGTFLRLQVAFALTGAGLYGITLSLVPMLQELGYSYRTAAVVFGLVGAGQVLGRLAFVPLGSRGSARTKTVVQVLLSGIALALLGLVVEPVVLVIACVVIAGAVRGAHTLSVATAVSDRWGATGYATIFGRFNLPIAIALALSPALTHLAAALLGSYQAAALLFAGASVVALALARRT
jgi:MFS family permease